MKKRKLFSTLTVFLFIFISVTFLTPQYLNAETRKFWIDTSHWETSKEWVSSGYWQVTPRQRWVDTSYTVTQGFWQDYTEKVWVTSGYWSSYWVDTSHWTWVSSGYWKSKWVDTSHWETRYRYVNRWVSCNKVFLYGTNSYGWSVYSFASKYKGRYEGTISGKRYRYRKYVIDYRPSYGGRVYAIRYECYQVLKNAVESYRVWISSGYWSRKWVDTSHWTWISSGYWKSKWVDTSHWENVAKGRWVDTSYTVSQGYWENYTETVWVDTSHWGTREEWVSEGHWVEAELNPKGKVLHTDRWNENRISYNLSKTGSPDDPRGYEIFFNGERFVLEAETAGDFDPESIHVEFLGTGFETDLTYTGNSTWEGYIWDTSFINFHDRDCVFKFTSSYDYEGDKFEIDDEVTVYIVRDYYWRLHRGF